MSSANERHDEPLPPSGGVFDALRGLFTPPHFKARAPVDAGVRFSGRKRGIAPLADVYLPDTAGPHPSVVLVHGGGFLVGSRDMKPMRFVATRLTEAGYAVMTFDYRMIFRGGRLDESVADVESAVAWWHRQRARYGLSRDSVALMGLSAGAALTMLTASVLPRGDVGRLVCVFGLYDFAALEGRRASLVRRWLLQTDDRAEWRARSPIEASDRVTQPALLIHGTADSIVPSAHTERLAARRRSQGLPVETRYIDGAPHGFFNDVSLAWAAEQAMGATLGFLAG